MRHLLSNANNETIAIFDSFNKRAIKSAIKKYLTENPNELVEHSRIDNSKKYYGDEIINFYACNKKGVPSLIITKGAKEFYKPLN